MKKREKKQEKREKSETREEKKEERTRKRKDETGGPPSYLERCMEKHRHC